MKKHFLRHFLSGPIFFLVDGIVLASVSDINQNGVPSESLKYDESERFHSNLDAKSDKKLAYKYTELLLYDNCKILNYGCGKCEFFDRIKNKFNNLKLVGYDIDEHYVKIAKEKGYDVYGSLEKVKGRFDFILASHLIEHLTGEQANLFFKQSRGYLDFGGKIIISTLNANELFNIRDLWDDPTHVKLYTLNSLKSLGKQHGFAVVKVYRYGSRVNPVKIIANVLLGMSIYTGLTVVLEKI